jgi:hypothetical protein
MGSPPVIAARRTIAPTAAAATTDRLRGLDTAGDYRSKRRFKKAGLKTRQV